MKNGKVQERYQLTLKLGILIQPFDDLVKREIPPNVSEYRIAMAKFTSGMQDWFVAVQAFATFAPDIVMHSERDKIINSVHRFRNRVNELIDESNELATLHKSYRNYFDEMMNNINKNLDAIPAVWEPEIFAANTPFTAYMRIKEAISSAKQRVHYFDRYLKVEFYELFLKSLDRNIEIKLITTEGKSNYGVKGVSSVSNLVRQEFHHYELVEVNPSDMHDRNLRVDDLVFTLGPGTDRAGIALTNFGPTDNSAQAHEQLDQIVKSGTIR
jgi:hypothetical protein